MFNKPVAPFTTDLAPYAFDHCANLFGKPVVPSTTELNMILAIVLIGLLWLQKHPFLFRRLFDPARLWQPRFGGSVRPDCGRKRRRPMPDGFTIVCHFRRKSLSDNMRSKLWISRFVRLDLRSGCVTSVSPDVWNKKLAKVFKSYISGSHSSFYFKCDVFKTLSPNFTKYLV